MRLRDGELEWREVDGEIVVLDLATSRYLAVNHSGAVLWRALCAEITRSALEATLSERYAIAPEAAAQAVEEFLAALRARGLLSEADPS